MAGGNSDPEKHPDPPHHPPAAAPRESGAPERTAAARTPLPRPPSPEPPPPSARAAWTQVLASHLCVFNTFGFINSAGVFAPYYARTLGRTPSEIAWIASAQVALAYGGGLVSGRALDAGHLRRTLAVGLALQVAGVFATAACTRYGPLLAAQGLVHGAGMGGVFCPAVANAAAWFSGRARQHRRALALAVVACGGATGGLVFPAMARALLPRVGFAWTVRAMGAVVLANAAAVLALARPPPQRAPAPPRRPPLVEWRAFAEPPYALYAASMFFAFWGVWIAYFYVRPFAVDVLAVADETSFDLILVLNGAGVPGRLLPALAADRWLGPVNVFVPAMFAAGASLLGWAAVASLRGLVAFAAVYGFFGAACQSLLQAALASLSADPKTAGTRMGMGFGVVGVASLTGSPIGGALIAAGRGRYLYAQMFAGATMVLGSLVLVAARVAKTGWVLRKRM